MDFLETQTFYTQDEMFSILLENEIHKDIIIQGLSDTCIARTWGKSGGNHHFMPEMECPKCKNKSINGYLCQTHINNDKYLRLGISGGIPTPLCYNRNNIYDDFNNKTPEEKLTILRNYPNK